MLELTDEDILLRLTNTEDSTVERKTASDYRDCLKTAVAFSNSLPVDDPGLIFVGVGNDGTVRENPNLESLQLKVSAEIGKVYPPIYPQMKVMQDRDGKKFLAVIVHGSKNRPHFAGPSYVRDGTQSKPASEEQFTRLIAERNSKVREMLKWKGKEIVVEFLPCEHVWAGTTTLVGGQRISAKLKDCNQFYVTLAYSYEARGIPRAFPLEDVQFCFDDEANEFTLRVTNRAL